MATIRDHTALIPWVLFGLFATIVGYAMWKGTHPTVKKEE